MNHIKRLLRPIVRQTLSPKTVQSLRWKWWFLSSYSPRRTVSRFIKRTPNVRGFGASFGLVKTLQSVNILAPTEMCRVMTRFGSDKGRPNNYTPLYSAVFQERRGQSLRMFELGLGSNNLDVRSNMGPFGAPGASLRGWCELFPHALVYGADIDRRVLFQENRIKTFYCNQLEQSSIRELWSQPDLQGGADIIIEDGLHTFEANISFLEGSLPQLRPGGIYVIEDIGRDEAASWYDRLENVYAKKFPAYEFAFVVLRQASLLFVRRSTN